MSTHKKRAATYVAVIGTGGTIEGVAPNPDHTYAYTDSQIGVEDLIEDICKQIDLPLTHCEQLFQTGSEDFTEAHWIALANRAQTLLEDDDVCGIVVTQGTDTLEETAYYLHLLLKTTKPVVVTGAMRPASAFGSDVRQNLSQAIQLASTPSAADLGVLVLINERIHSAREVVKAHTLALDSFVSPGTGPLGLMIANSPVWQRRPVRAHTLATPFTFPLAGLARVDLVWAHVGIRPDVIAGSVRAGARGIVFAGTGNGSIAAQIKPVLREAVSSGCHVIRASRVFDGPVVRNAAENDDELGTIAAGTLMAIKARVLLQLALTQDKLGDLQGLFDTY